MAKQQSPMPEDNDKIDAALKWVSIILFFLSFVCLSVASYAPLARGVYNLIYNSGLVT